MGDRWYSSGARPAIDSAASPRRGSQRPAGKPLVIEVRDNGPLFELPAEQSVVEGATWSSTRPARGIGR
ncbi:MAG: hypothetical protein U0736_11960 [Gemmataceae bacterium]